MLCTRHLLASIKLLKHLLIEVLNEMALYKWLCPADDVLDPKGPLPQAIPYSVITEVNREVKNVSPMRKHSLYPVWSPEIGVRGDVSMIVWCTLG